MKKGQQRRYLQKLSGYMLEFCDVDAKTRRKRLDAVAKKIAKAAEKGLSKRQILERLGSFDDICADLPLREKPVVGRLWAAALLLTTSGILLFLAVYQYFFPATFGVLALGHEASYAFAAAALACYWLHRYWAKIPRFDD